MSGSACVQQNHFSLSRNKCLELINQAQKKSNRKSLSDDFSMFRASPTSSPNLSVKKSIHAHKSLIQWSFPVKRVKCYLIECAVSYQRETARPSLTIHITRSPVFRFMWKSDETINRNRGRILDSFGSLGEVYWILRLVLKKPPITKSENNFLSILNCDWSSAAIKQAEYRSCLTSDIQIRLSDPGQLVLPPLLWSGELN